MHQVPLGGEGILTKRLFPPNEKIGGPAHLPQISTAPVSNRFPVCKSIQLIDPRLKTTILALSLPEVKNLRLVDPALF